VKSSELLGAGGCLYPFVLQSMERLIVRVTQQELEVDRLEEEVKVVVGGERTGVNIVEEKQELVKAKEENQKLRYRLRILQEATERELKQYTEKTTIEMTPLCSLCQAPTSSYCPECNIPCCSLHITAHRPRDVCMPFTVRVQEGLGRYVVATRDIAAMEVILEDTPAVLGPNYETEAVCVECLGRVNGSVLCHLCNLPMCSEECRDGPRHKPECQMFSGMEPKVTIKQYKTQLSANNATGTVCYEYGCISVLRLLALRDTDPESWERVQLLMDHDQERREEKEYWKMFQGNVVDYIRKKGGLADTYSEEEIHRAIGILRTNAFQVEHPYMVAVGTSGKAIYPTFSFLSHSCLANARYAVMHDDTLVLRAQVDIKAGEEITIQYISFIFGNRRRRKDIHQSWMFECACARCTDRTELGQMFSAHLCEACSGPVLPEDSNLYCPIWRCEECSKETTASDIEAIETEIEQDMFDTFETDTAKYRVLIDKWSNKIHPNHYQLLLMKKYLAISLRGQLTYAEVEEKIALQEEFIRAFEVVDPGCTKWRGKMLFVITKLTMFLIDSQMAREKISREKFLSELQRCIEQLEEVIKMMEHEPQGSSEYKISLEARAHLNQAKDILIWAQ